MCAPKNTLHGLIISPALLLFLPFTASQSASSYRRWRTSARAGRGVEVVLMRAAVVLALPEQQNSGRVTTRRTDPGRVAGQALAVTG